MSASVVCVLPTGPTTFTCAVSDGVGVPSWHHIEITQRFLTQTGLTVAAPDRVAHQALVLLLGHTLPSELPSEIDLVDARSSDELLVRALRSSLLD